jgi:fucose 4-O-acetylase-like acetyltransferase
MRNPFLDNAKAVLIAFVILGHLLEPILDRSFFAHTLYFLIYAFHMPAFIFLAGTTTKLEKWGRKDISLLWGLLVFQCAYEGMTQFGNYKESFSFPYWFLWFVLSLLFWRIAAMLTYKKLQLPKWLIFSLAILLSVVAGFFPLGRNLSMMRTFVFCPFFFLGLFYGQKLVNVTRYCSSKAKIAGLTVLIVASILAAFFSFDAEWLYGAGRYSAMACPIALPWLFRMLLLATGFILTMAFLMLIPSQKCRWTDYGKRTLSIYLFHGFLALPLRHFLAHMPLTLAWLAALTGTVTIVVIFSTETASRTLDGILAMPIKLSHRFIKG